MSEVLELENKKRARLKPKDLISKAVKIACVILY